MSEVSSAESNSSSRRNTGTTSPSSEVAGTAATGAATQVRCKMNVLNKPWEEKIDNWTQDIWNMGEKSESNQSGCENALDAESVSGGGGSNNLTRKRSDDISNYNLQSSSLSNSSCISVTHVNKLSSKPRDSKYESQKLAVKAQERFARNDVKGALDLYNAAIALYQGDARYFCNRSYCFSIVKRYKSALDDAHTAISMDPSRSKAHFMKGKALIGLRQYEAAEESFQKAQRLEPIYDDELKEVRILSLLQLGFSAKEARAGGENYDSIQAAIDGLVSQDAFDATTTAAEKGIKNMKNPASTETIDIGDPWDEAPSEIEENLDVTTSNSKQDRKKFNSTYHKQSNYNYQSHDSCPKSSNFKKASSRHFLEELLQEIRKNDPDSSSTEQSEWPTSSEKNSFSDDDENNEDCQGSELSSEERLRQIYGDHQYEEALKSAPVNEVGYLGLWIGNVNPKCKKRNLYETFRPFGRVENINIINASFCAFISYNNPNSPGKRTTFSF